VLSTKLLLAAYCQGIFPMAVNAQGTIAWYSPDPRALIPLDDRFHIPRGLERTLRRNKFEITVDAQFEGVIRACSKAHGDSWISGEIINSYIELNREGFAHSVEICLEGELVGGLYGVHIGGAFFGESMFHLVTDASKVALVALVERLRKRAFVLLDTQWATPHLKQFGTYLVPKYEYLQLLRKAISLDRQFDV